MNKTLLIFALLLPCFLNAQYSETCVEMIPICTDVGLTFQANSGVLEAEVTEPGNEYDCLDTSPNPTWYYFQIATDGNIEMELSALFDIDYAIWGPFTSLSQAQGACGSLGDQTPPNPSNGNLVDCGYSGASVENPVITSAVTGEFYVMLITNYAEIVQNISLTQTGGTGSTDCSIVTDPPCAVSSFITNISGCDFATNNYQISGSVSITDPPTTGDLVFEDCYGNTTVLASAPFTSNTVNYTIANLLANGDACSVQAYFTDQVSCGQTVNYVAPVCINNCPTYELQSSSPAEACGNQMYWLEIENSGCDGFIEFDVVGNYGSEWANEISWTVTSNTTNNIVAQGGPGTDGGAINLTVGPLDPSVEGAVYTLQVLDVFGDGFNGTGGTISIQQEGVILTNALEGNFGAEGLTIVQAGISVSSSTLSVITPGGTITNVSSNCVDHEVGIMLNNTNFCTPISVDLPWTIFCDDTGDLIASGTQTVIVYPQVPSSAADLVSISWNTTSCSWDISANNDCSELDIGSIFTITPDASSLGPYCSNGSESFSISYIGLSGAPNCCSTAGPVSQITYSDSQTITDVVAIGSPFGGVNNSAHISIPALGDGGNATDANINISFDGYCFDPPSTQTNDSYWVTIYVDGVIIYDQQQFLPPGTFNQTFTLADMTNGYNENSVLDVYVYPNAFSANGINTTFVAGASCPFPGDGNWTISNITSTFTATYEQTTSTPINCDFPLTVSYTCCVLSTLNADAPAPASVQCSADVPAVDINSVTNIVSDCPVVVSFVSDASDGNTCPETITRTYSVTDDCGNSINVTQTIAVNDITPPVFSTPPANITVECVDDIPAMIDLSWIDNCDGVGAVTGVDGSIFGPPLCGGTFTRTWTYTDACGNVATETQVITIVDTTPPVFDFPPANITVECVGDVPAMIDLSWTDNCAGAGSVAGADGSIVGGSCGGTITRTWTYMDACENIVTATQVITIDDTTPPTASSPAGLTVECIGDVPAADVSVVTDAADNCTVLPLVDFVSEVSNGNSSSTTIYSETFDSGTIAGANASVLYGNGGSDFNPAYAFSGTFFGWFNVQNGIGDVDIYEQNFNALTAGCTVSLSVWLRGTTPISDITITLTDDNGVVLSVLDPVLTTSWQLVTINVNTTTPGLNFLIHYNSTGSGAGADVIMEDLLVTQECASSVCPEIITRTYSVTDDCGNATNVTQTITVNDLTPPTASNPIGVTVECIGDIPSADVSVVTDAADNCTAIPTVSFVSDASDGNTCPEVITRTYSITDDCGNSTNISQTITVNDITPPTALNPSNINIPLAPAPAPDITVVIDAVDNCTADPIVAFVSDQSDGGDCPEVITRTYSLSDDCGNETLVTQLIIIGGGLVPAPTVMANGPICEGEDAVFTIDGLDDAVVTYDLGTGANTVTLVGGTAVITVPSVGSDITITLSNIADGSCSSIIELSATTVLNLFEAPSFNSFGPYCQNETADVLPTTSLNGYTGTWSPSIIDVSVSGTEIYTFTPDAGQCAFEKIIEVEVTELVVPLFTQIDDICEGAEVFPGGSPFPVASTEGIIGVWAPVFDAFNTTTYTFTPDPAFCATTTTMTITIVGFPDVDAGLDQIITCNNNVGGAQLGSAEVPGNVYSWSPTTGLSDPNIANPIANPSVSTTYTLTVTNSTGCSAEGSVNVSVDDTPPVVAITNNTGSTTLTCTQLEISVTAIGADTYAWDNGLGNIASATITALGIYTVTGTALNGCQSSAQIEVIQDNGVDLLLALAELEICSGEAVDISMNSSNATDFNWTVIENGVTGASNGNAINAGFGASISQVLTLTGAINGTVDYLVEPILGGCVGTTQTVTVTVLAPETPQFNPLGPFCINDVSTALPIMSIEGISGTWSPAAVNTTTVGTSTYSFVPNLGQCADNQTMDIVVNELPVVSFSGDSLVGCSPHTVVLTSLNDNCSWTISNGIFLEGCQATLVLTNPGCYDVTLQVDDGGCANSLTMPSYICIEQDPIADFTASPDMFTDDDALVSFTNLSSGASSFVWDFGDGNTSNYINPSNLYESTEEGALITLTAISEFGCQDQAQLIIEYDEQEVFYIPNTFTPDGDNFNQMFTPIFYSGFDPYNFEMLIFNRWGEIVFETHNTEIGWDGTYGVKGTKATDGAYSWKITYKNPKTDERKVIVGHVTLMR